MTSAPNYRQAVCCEFCPYAKSVGTGNSVSCEKHGLVSGVHVCNDHPDLQGTVPEVELGEFRLELLERLDLLERAERHQKNHGNEAAANHYLWRRRQLEWALSDFDRRFPL